MERIRKFDALADFPLEQEPWYTPNRMPSLNVEHQSPIDERLCPRIMDKSRKVRWEGGVGRVIDMRHAYEILVGKPK